MNYCQLRSPPFLLGGHLGRLRLPRNGAVSLVHSAGTALDPFGAADLVVLLLLTGGDAAVEHTAALVPVEPDEEGHADALAAAGKDNVEASNFTLLAMQSTRNVLLHIERPDDLGLWMMDCEARGITTKKILPI